MPHQWRIKRQKKEKTLIFLYKIYLRAIVFELTRRQKLEDLDALKCCHPSGC
jgi:hypothetical protein